MSQFYEVELDLKFTFNIFLHSINFLPYTNLKQFKSHSKLNCDFLRLRIISLFISISGNLKLHKIQKEWSSPSIDILICQWYLLTLFQIKDNLPISRRSLWPSFRFIYMLPDTQVYTIQSSRILGMICISDMQLCTLWHFL